jgi:hypothetical protein
VTFRKPRFRLRFPEGDLATWAARFPDDGSDEPLLADVRPRALGRGYLTRGEFLRLCAWKSPRSRPRCRENPERHVVTLTRAAFASPDEATKVELLRLLRGVEWPTASAILHFGDAAPYPILDYRAAWSVGVSGPPRYTLEFWLAYVDFTRALADRSGLSIRTVDRALWQYAKERQG